MHIDAFQAILDRVASCRQNIFHFGCTSTGGHHVARRSQDHTERFRMVGICIGLTQDVSQLQILGQGRIKILFPASDGSVLCRGLIHHGGYTAPPRPPYNLRPFGIIECLKPGVQPLSLQSTGTQLLPVQSSVTP